MLARLLILIWKMRWLLKLFLWRFILFLLREIFLLLILLLSVRQLSCLGISQSGIRLVYISIILINFCRRNLINIIYLIILLTNVLMLMRKWFLLNRVISSHSLLLGIKRSVRLRRQIIFLILCRVHVAIIIVSRRIV